MQLCSECLGYYKQGNVQFQITVRVLLASGGGAKYADKRANEKRKVDFFIHPRLCAENTLVYPSNQPA